MIKCHLGTRKLIKRLMSPDRYTIPTSRHLTFLYSRLIVEKAELKRQICIVISDNYHYRRCDRRAYWSHFGRHRCHRHVDAALSWVEGLSLSVAGSVFVRHHLLLIVAFRCRRECH